MVDTPDIDSLRPAPYNPRQMPAEAAAGLSASMQDFGDVIVKRWETMTGQEATRG